MWCRHTVASLLILSAVGCVTVESTGVHRGTDAERLRAHLDLARGYLENRDVARARKPLNRALEIDQHSWEAHDLYALLYEMEGESDLANHQFRLALRSAPRNARVLNNYGAFLYSEGRYREARRRLVKATEDPNYVGRSHVYENLGLVQLKLGHVKDAESSFQRALKLNPNQPQSSLELAEIYFNRGDFDAARNYYDAYRKLAAQGPRSLWLGIRLAEVSDDEDAIASFGLQLKNMYPESREYQLYQESLQ